MFPPLSELTNRLAAQLDAPGIPGSPRDPSRLAADVLEWLPRDLAASFVAALEAPGVARSRQAARLAQEQTTSVPGVTSTPAAETRGDLDAIVGAPISVHCPTCGAAAGSPCIDGRSPKVPRKNTHPERRVRS